MTDEELNKIGNLIDQKNRPIVEKLSNLEDSINDTETGLKAINQKVDSVIEELAIVHQKVDVTYDLVKFHKEKTEEELDEIREHTHMPKIHREPLKFTS